VQAVINILKRLAIVFFSIAIGGVVNMFFITNSSKIIAPPPGTNLTTETGLKAAMPLMEPKHFIMPFVAHAIGTFVAAFFITAAMQLLLKKSNLILALLPGFCFLVGGIMMVQMLPSPMWFTITDLVFAYIPMAYLGYWLGEKYFNKHTSLKPI
jgi:hypothetical protein